MGLLTEKTLLEDIKTNTTGMGTSQFTALNSTNVDLSKGLLEDIKTNTTGMGTSQFTALNSTNVNTSKADLDLIVATQNASVISTDLTLASIGLPVIAPTQYTLLERLKNIETNTLSEFTALNSANIDLSYAELQDINTYTYYDYINHIDTRFTSTIEITRPADTTAYTKGDIINGNGLTAMGIFDLSSTPYANFRNVKIDTITVASSGVCDVNVILYPVATLGAQTFSDNDVFNPAYADFIKVHSFCSIATLTTMSVTTPNIYETQTLSNGYQIYTDNNSYLYLTLIVRTAFTPISAQKFSITIKGQLI